MVNSAAHRADEIFPPAAALTCEYRRVGLQGSESRDLLMELGLKPSVVTKMRRETERCWC